MPPAIHHHSLLQRSPLAAFMVLLACLAVGAFYILLLTAHRIRRTGALHAELQLIETELDDVPFSFRPILGEFTQQWVSLGFAVVANVSMSQARSGVRTTISLLVNRSTREMAVIACRSRAGKYRHFSQCITEFSDGARIETIDDPAMLLGSRPPKEYLTTLPPESSPRLVYHRHQEWVREIRPEGGERVIPDEGNEVEFFKAEYKRTLDSEYSGYALDKAGKFYRPRWGTAFKMAVAENAIFRKGMLWLARRSAARSSAIRRSKSSPSTAASNPA